MTVRPMHSEDPSELHIAPQAIARLLVFFIIAVCISVTARAQYSEDAFTLKSAQEQYGENGYLNNASIAVDGKLIVSGSNAAISYSYPISSQVRNGYPVNVTLNYCGSVAFTTFRKHVSSHDLNMTPYRGWEKFSQNRPVWILGVNGFALNILGHIGHFINDSNSRIFDRRENLFDDRDFVFCADGYDFCNRMADLNPDYAGQDRYVDVIRLLRSDGSLLELANVQNKNEGDSSADIRQNIYTGYYTENVANPSAYGIVEYDSTYWPEYIRELLNGRADWQRAALVPRKLRYFPSDGLEYVFREWIIPYGPKPYRAADHISGGVWAGPTIFYLEEIRSNSGIVAGFHRTRHYPQIPSPGFGGRDDLTRGRALYSEFADHTISYGHNSMIIEALGRSTKVKFDVIQRSGTSANEILPYANAGSMTPLALELAKLGETDPRLHRGYLAYITEIIDPEDRVTRFTYENHSRVYENFNFPMENLPGVTQRITLANKRLKTITEPTSKYVLSYRPGYSGAISRMMTATPELYQESLNDVVDSVDTYDPFGVKLTTAKYAINFAAHTSDVTTIDRLSGATRHVSQTFQALPLDQIIPYSPPPRHTVTRLSIESAGDLITTTETMYGRGDDLPGVTLDHRYVIQPVWATTTVNTIVQSHQTFAYDIDTVRYFGGNGTLAGRFGIEITRQVARTMRPDSLDVVLFTDTTELLHLERVDTVLAWKELQWKKLQSWRNYDSLDSVGHPFVQGKSFAELRYTPPVGHYEEVIKTEHIRIPPLTGLVRASWRTADDPVAGRLVTGKRSQYETGIARGMLRPPRGRLLADTIIGNGGSVLPGGVYRYAVGYLGDLPQGATNALGARTLVNYDFFLCTDDTSFQCQYAPPVAHIMTSDDSVRSFTMTESAYAPLFGKPVAERRIVRRYDPSGSLIYDTLATFSDVTHHGLTSGAVDANGWYSAFDYDRNGRLNMAWLPYDFPRAGAPDTASYSGSETMEFGSETWYHRRTDILHCELNPITNLPFSWTEPGAVEHTVTYDTLYASQPIIAPPVCPCEQSSSMPYGEGLDDRRRKDEKGRQLLRTCIQDIHYPTHAGYRALYGVIEHRVDSASELQYASSIDSLNLELMISAVDGECVHLELAIDTIYTRTFILGCTEKSGDDDEHGQGMPYQGSGDERGRTEKGDDRDLLASGVTRVAGGYRLVADLRSIAPQLQAKPVGSVIRAELRVKTAGATVAFISGGNAEDLRPKLRVVGNFRRPGKRDDNTLAFSYDDENLISTRTAKIDDRLHSANIIDPVVPGSSVRRTSATHHFGANGRVLLTERNIIEPQGGDRKDSVRAIYDGVGQVRMAIDQEGNRSRTVYDHSGRVTEMVHADSARTYMSYRYGKPGDFGLTGQDFYGLCAVTSLTNENGVVFTTYSDALGNKRREVADTAGMRLVTRFNYDLLGRMTTAINPKGDTTRYTYDAFGRVKTKSQPDLGTVSYAYDAVGNVRFTQTQKQADEGRLTFNQYDDLNRPVLIGEANLSGAYYDEDNDGIVGSSFLSGTERDDDNPMGMPGRDGSRHNDAAMHKRSDRALQSAPDAGRLTTTLNPDVLHTSDGSILTANRSIWRAPMRQVPVVASGFAFRYCLLQPLAILGETTPPERPLLKRPAQLHNLIPGVRSAQPKDFENAGLYPEFVRTVVAYDTLPASLGTAWGGFPEDYEWHALAPRGMVRNQRGREAAVAYRERAAEPFHYVVMSYDERGRVEALLRFTENLGFDAVYYSYNSMNQVTSVTTADMMRQHTTWYGYDANGRVDSVWTALSGVGGGLFSNFQIRYPGIQERPATADLHYHYNSRGLVDSMAYIPINTGISYAYNSRSRLDSLVATQPVPGLGMRPLFKQVLEYDAIGQILTQRWQHGVAPEQEHTYFYDRVERLKRWTSPTETTTYPCDVIGNRIRKFSTGFVYDEIYDYAPGTNRLETHVAYDEAGNAKSTFYQHTPNGSVRQREHWDFTGGNGDPKTAEQFAYSYRELPHRMQTYDREPGNPSFVKKDDWRYRYNAGGEREQKRMYLREYDSAVPAPGEKPAMPWVYYLLGGNREQLALYHGQQRMWLDTTCGDIERRVYMYPVEYLTHGIAYTGVREDLAPIVTLPDGSRQYRISDHLASLRVMVDANGTQQYDYDPWGTSLSGAVTGGSRRTYNDREQDTESGDYNLGRRQMADEVGQFLSVDPLWETSRAESPYLYAKGNPLRYTDPEGLQAKEVKSDFSSYMDGLFINGPMGLLEAAINQGQYMICPPYFEYKRLEGWLDGSTLAGIEAKIDELKTSSNARAELGGEITFYALFYGGVNGLGNAFNAAASRGGAAAARGGGAAAARQGVATDLAIVDNGAHKASNLVNLNKSLASEQQMGEAGTIMAGANARVAFRDAARIAKQYGGEAADWVKKTSSSYSCNGTRFETHWVENVKTGQRVEFKTKMPGGN